MTDKHYNDHRKFKRSFQANLPLDEHMLVERVKRMRGAQTDRELIVLLCRDYVERVSGPGEPGSSAPSA